MTNSDGLENPNTVLSQLWVVSTNLAVLPAVWLLIKRTEYTEAFLLFQAASISSIYHVFDSRICDIVYGWYGALHFADQMTSWLSTLCISLFVVLNTHHRHGILIGIVPMFVAFYTEKTHWGYTPPKYNFWYKADNYGNCLQWSSVVAVVGVVVFWRNIRNPRHFCPKRIAMLVAACICAYLCNNTAAGAGVGDANGGEKLYSIWHGFWHIFIYMASFFAVYATPRGKGGLEMLEEEYVDNENLDHEEYEEKSEMTPLRRKPGLLVHVNPNNRFETEMMELNVTHPRSC